MFLSINFNIKVCLIFMQITTMFDHCADHHLSNHYANMIQLLKSYVVILMHNSKMCRISKETIIHNLDTLM